MKIDHKRRVSLGDPIGCLPFCIKRCGRYLNFVPSSHGASYSVPLSATPAFEPLQSPLISTGHLPRSKTIVLRSEPTPSQHPFQEGKCILLSPADSRSFLPPRQHPSVMTGTHPTWLRLLKHTMVFLNEQPSRGLGFTVFYLFFRTIIKEKDLTDFN